tara:strand:- start:4006 stop:4614 length:609 start_codon:yes stop_codon:yes gene_type:complete
MNFYFDMIYPGKPWHHKVIRSIQVDIQSQIEPLPSAKLPLLIAEFDMNRSAGIEIVSGAQGKDEFLKFIFFSEDWGDMTDAKKKATNQLLSGIESIIPGTKLISESDRVHVKKKKVTIKEDGLNDLFITVKHMNYEAFSQKLEEFESHFENFKHAEVCGSGYGSGGGNIDLTYRDYTKIENKVLSTLEAIGILDYQLSKKEA